jgi:hypothetical protein
MLPRAVRSVKISIDLTGREEQSCIHERLWEFSA